MGEFIWIGGQPTERGIERLEQIGVTRVIDLRYDSLHVEGEMECCRKHGIYYIQMPMGYSIPSLDFAFTIVRLLAASGDMPTYLHCGSGINRSPAILALFQLTTNLWDLKTVGADLLLSGFDPHHGRLADDITYFANEIKRLQRRGLIPMDHLSKDILGLSTIRAKAIK